MEINLVIITSCINTPMGVFDSDQRYLQTLATINSIKTKIPNSHIIILETSNFKFENSDVLLTVYYHNNEILNQLLNKFNNDVIQKSLSELFIIHHFLNNFPYITNYKRIFKISGRYWLSEQFNIQDYDYSMSNKFVFKHRLNTPYDLTITNNIPFQLKTRLWSVDTKLHDYTIKLLHTMFTDYLNLLSINRYADIEHLFFKHIDKKQLLELDIIGVAGLQAPDSQLIIE